MKITFFSFCIILFFSDLALAQVDCFWRDNELSKRNSVTKHYSPYFNTAVVSNLSTIIMGASMPVSKEELKENELLYDLAGLYAFGQWFGMQMLGCGGHKSPLKPEDYNIDNVDQATYSRLRNYFWVSYAMNVGIIYVLAEHSKRGNRNERVAATVAIPWVFDLLVNRTFFSYKYKLYDNPVFFNVLPDPDTKEQQVSLNYRFTY